MSEQNKDLNEKIKHLSEQLELRNECCEMLKEDIFLLKQSCEILQRDRDAAKNCIKMIIKLNEEKDDEIMRLKCLLDKDKDTFAKIKNNGSNLGAGKVSDQMLPASGNEMKTATDKTGKDCLLSQNPPHNLRASAALNQIMAQKEEEFRIFDAMLAKFNETIQYSEQNPENPPETENDVKNLQAKDTKGKAIAEENPENVDSSESGEGEEEDDMHLPILSIGKLMRKGGFGDRCIEMGSSSKSHLVDLGQETEEFKIGEKRKEHEGGDLSHLKEIKREKKDKSWKDEKEMINNVLHMPQLLLESVCVLDRMERSSKIWGHKNEGVDPSDVTMITKIAEVLTQGNPWAPVMLTVEELNLNIPGGYEHCIRLLITYVKKIFHIYKNRLDPFFCEPVDL